MIPVLRVLKTIDRTAGKAKVSDARAEFASELMLALRREIGDTASTHTVGIASILQGAVERAEASAIKATRKSMRGRK